MLAVARLDGGDDVDLVVLAAALAARATADERLVQLHGMPAADRIACGPHHAGAELVQNLEGRLVAR